MRAFSTLALAGLAWLALGSTSFADVTISIHDGQVSLAAKDATVRQILTEWARVGHTQIVNVERISGGPITIEFNNVPEQEALDMLLRSVSGYMAAPRAVAVSDASLFERVVVMPTTAAQRPAPSAAPPAPAPFAQLNGIIPQPQDDDDNRQQPGLQLPPALAPIFSNFPQQQLQQQGPNGQGPNGQPRRALTPNSGQGVFGPMPQQVDPQNGQPVSAPPQTPNAPPASPFGAVSAPGMIAPAPAQPGQVFPQGLPQGFPPVPQQPQPRRSPNEN
jgi:hypothetical protein